ncbi:hypothetical protein ACUN9V_18765 [Salinicola sp. V024]
MMSYNRIRHPKPTRLQLACRAIYWVTVACLFVYAAAGIFGKEA